MRFFIGADEVPVSVKQRGEPVQHYAWCLEQASQALLKASDKHSQTHVLKNFEKNMRQLPATQAMLQVVDDTFQAFLESNDKHSNQYILTFLSGIRVPELGYISVCQ